MMRGTFTALVTPMLPAGPCRQPLGRLTPAGLQTARESLERIRQAAPAVFEALPAAGRPLDTNDPSLCYPEGVLA